MRCTVCKKTKDKTYPVSRHGGGNYRRAGRTYHGQMCQECLLEAASSPYERWDGYETSGLRRTATVILGIRTYQSNLDVWYRRKGKETVHSTLSSTLYRFRSAWAEASTDDERRAIAAEWIAGTGDSQERHVNDLTREHRNRAISKLVAVYLSA